MRKLRKTVQAFSDLVNGIAWPMTCHPFLKLRKLRRPYGNFYDCKMGRYLLLYKCATYFSSCNVDHVSSYHLFTMLKPSGKHVRLLSCIVNLNSADISIHLKSEKGPPQLVLMGAKRKLSSWIPYFVRARHLPMYICLLLPGCHVNMSTLGLN